MHFGTDSNPGYSSPSYLHTGTSHMASISTAPNGNVRILFVGGDKK